MGELPTNCLLCGNGFDRKPVIGEGAEGDEDDTFSKFRASFNLLCKLLNGDQLPNEDLRLKDHPCCNDCYLILVELGKLQEVIDMTLAHQQELVQVVKDVATNSRVNSAHNFDGVWSIFNKQLVKCLRLQNDDNVPPTPPDDEEGEVLSHPSPDSEMDNFEDVSDPLTPNPIIDISYSYTEYKPAASAPVKKRRGRPPKKNGNPPGPKANANSTATSAVKTKAGTRMTRRSIKTPNTSKIIEEATSTTSLPNTDPDGAQEEINESIIPPAPSGDEISAKSLQTGRRRRKRFGKNSGRHVCSICNKTFARLSCVQHHQRTIHNPARKGIECRICHRVLISRGNLAIHYKIKHDPTYKKEIKCPHPSCDKLFHTHANANFHHQMVHTPTRRIPCEVCGLRCKNRQSLRTHMLRHSNARPFNCAHCGKTFKRKCVLDVHLDTHDPHRERTFKCNLCDKAFLCRVHLSSHRRIKHNPNYTRRFKCPFATCTKMFFTPGQADKHLLIHSQVREFKCEVEGCNKEFKTAREVQLHSVTHSDARPFVCEVCGKSFKRKSELTGHNKRHLDERPYSCDICKKSFKKRATLRSHVKKIHDNNLPHKCPICQKGFEKEKTIKRHIYLMHDPIRGKKLWNPRFDQKKQDSEGATESTEKSLKELYDSVYGDLPYRCPVCHKGYPKELSMRRHLSIIHGVGRRRKKEAQNQQVTQEPGSQEGRNVARKSPRSSPKKSD